MSLQSSEPTKPARRPTSAPISPRHRAKTAWTPGGGNLPPSARDAFTLRPTDVSLLRLMYREKPDSLSGIDPQLGASRLAKRLGIGRSRVAARLSAWANSGFLSKYAVWLNPALLHHQGIWVKLWVDQPGLKPEVIRQISLIDGVVSATEFLGTEINLGMIGRDSVQLKRRLRLLGALAGVKEVGPVENWIHRDVERRLTPLEIRLVQTLRADPMASLRDAARRMGISERTFTRKYTALVESSAVWFQPVFDFREVASAFIVLRAVLAPEADTAAITHQLSSRYPLVVELAQETDVAIGARVRQEWAVVLPSVASVDELTQYATSLEGVEDVEWSLPVRTYDFPHWFDERLDDLSSSDRHGVS